MTLIPRGFVVVATPLLLLGLVCDAAAMCDVVPGAPAFRGFRGQLDRPFASPGDWIELRPNDVCAAGSPAFADLEEGKLAISLVFKPRPKKKKQQNKKHAVVLTRNCGDVDMGVFGLQANRTHCVATQDGFKLQLGADSSEHKLDIRFPAGICVGGTHPRLPCEIGGSCPGGGICKKAEGKRRLTGLMALAVTQEQSGSNPAKKPLPTDLVAKRCQNVSQETTACVDFLYPMDGSCDTQERDDVFPSLVALPPPNDYQKLCTHADPTSPDSPDCLGTDTNLRFALDVRGDALIPIRWKKIKNPTEGRFVQTSTAVPPVAGDTGPVRLPNDDFVTSFSVKGKILPALFEPELSPSRPNELTLFGMVDGNRSVLRVSRRYREEGEFKKCVGGGPLGHPCSKNQDCAPGTCTKESVCRVAGGELCKEDGDCAEGVDCGLSLFAQRSRNQGGTGPAVISRAPPEDVGICDETGLATPDNDGKYCDAGVNCAGACVDLRAEAGAHVPFAPLPQSEQLIASVIPEAAVRRSFNGDIDLNDAVVTVREIASGNLIPIGMGNGCDVPQSCSALASCTSLSPGRASHANPNNPKQDITVSGNLVSFIEKCSDQPANSCTADALRIFSRTCQDSSGKSLPQMIEVVGTPPVSEPLVLDPSPVIDGKSAQITPSEQLLLRDPCGVLNAIDLRNGGLKAPRFAEPATLVVTAGDSVAFLQPESPPRMAGCTQPVHARDLNGDGDVKDVLVRLWPGPDDELWPREGGNGGSAMNPKLWLDATEVALSEGWLAAIARDGSVNVRALKDPKQEWSPVGRGGEKLAASGDVVAYLERERGNRLLRVHFPAAPRTEPAEFSAVDFVLGDLQPSGCVGGAQPWRQLLAFRSDEIFFAAPQQEAALRSSDGPFLHLIDLGRAAEAGMLRAGLLSSGEPASRCDVPLCPDGPPYEVLPRMIRFFSREPGSDRLLARVIDTCDARLRSPPLPGPVKRPFDGFRYAMDPTLTGVFLGGRCVDGKEALGVCLADEDCPAALSCGPALAVIYARDGDGDGIDDSLDNCPKEYNQKQTDSDGDGVGDECEGS